MEASHRHNSMKLPFYVALRLDSANPALIVRAKSIYAQVRESAGGDRPFMLKQERTAQATGDQHEPTPDLSTTAMSGAASLREVLSETIRHKIAERVSEILHAGSASLTDVLAAAGRTAIEASRYLLKSPAASAAVLGMATASASGAELLNASQEPLQRGTIPGEVFLTYNYNDGTTNINYGATGFVIGKQITSSGKFIQSFIAVPYHESGAPHETLTGGGDGTNHITDPGRPLQNLTLVYSSPLWNSNAPDENAGDIRILSTTTEFPDSSIMQIAPDGTVANSTGKTATSYGFGNLSYVGGSSDADSNGYEPATGYSYFFSGPIEQGGPTNVDESGDYASIDFDTTFHLKNAGAGNEGDSGSPVVLNVNGQNELIGFDVTVTGGPNDQQRITSFANLTNQSYETQIAPYEGIQDPPDGTTPEPAVLSYVVVGGFLLTARIRSRSKPTQT